MDDLLRRVAPQNLEAEQSVLGAVLLDNTSISYALGLVVAEDFYRETHREIFRAMVFLSDNRQPVDAITLVERLRTGGTLDAVGGPAYIAELASIVPTAANIEHYARIVRKKSILRTFITTDLELADLAYDGPDDVDGFLDVAERRLLAIGGAKTGNNFVAMPEASREALKAIEFLFENKQVVTGIGTGFQALDFVTGGLQKAELIVIAARPSMGKTALALNIATHAAITGGCGVAFFSLEMSRSQLMVRMMCSEAGIDATRIRQGNLAGGDFMALAGAAARISECELVIDDDSNITPVQLKAACRRLRRQLEDRGRRLDLVVVDYLQLMNPGRERDNREREIADMTKSLKALAKELEIPVLALSQLNRAVETRADRRPVLADLRESGAIEQDADVVAFIYRDEVYHKDSADAGTAEIIIAKQRNGPTDTIKLSFLKHLTRFQDFDDRFIVARGA